jgi:hypothetical protein
MRHTSYTADQAFKLF